MAGFLRFTEKLSRLMNVISYIALTFIMLLTVADVIMRMGWIRRPIIGTFEIVGMVGAIVIGFGVPLTSWVRGLVSVDVIVNKLPGWGKNFMNILTRVISIIIFIVIGYNLFGYATDLLVSGEVTPTRQIPFYPVVYGLGIACFIQCLVLIADIIKVIRGTYE